MSNLITFDVDTILENDDSAPVQNDQTESTENTDKPKTKRVKRPVFSLPVYCVETNRLFERIAKKPTRDDMHKLRNKYKTESLTICNDVELIRSELRNDANKLIAKSFLITLKNNDDKIKPLPSIDFNYSLKRETKPDSFDSDVLPHFLSADSMPHRLSLTAFVLRVLKPYHDIKTIHCTTKKTLCENALVVNYKMTAFDLVFNACMYVFKHVPTSILCSYALMNALFNTDLSISDDDPKLNLKTLKSLL